jgi:hypothetical protein
MFTVSGRRPPHALSRGPGGPGRERNGVLAVAFLASTLKANSLVRASVTRDRYYDFFKNIYA